MKNRKFVYGLILSVTAVWGIVFYRIFAVNRDDENREVESPSVFSKISLKEYKLLDTTTLTLNYRDPFGEVNEPAPPVSIVKKPVIPVKIVNPVVLSREYVKYGGYIINPQTKNVVSILTINGREQMMNEGQVVGEVRLSKNHVDSVEVSYKNKTFFIRKSN